MSRYQVDLETEGLVDAALKEVRDELLNAMRHFGPMVSPHEAASILREEHDEWWEEVKRHNVNKPKMEVVGAMRLEIIQVAAMAVRALVDVVDPLHTALVRQPDFSTGYRPSGLAAHPLTSPDWPAAPQRGADHTRIVPRVSAVIPEHVPPPELYVAGDDHARLLAWDIDRKYVVQTGSAAHMDAWAGGWIAYWEGRAWDANLEPSTLLDSRREGWRAAMDCATAWVEGFEVGRGMRPTRSVSLGVDSLNAYLAGVERGKAAGPYAE